MLRCRKEEKKAKQKTISGIMLALLFAGVSAFAFNIQTAKTSVTTHDWADGLDLNVTTKDQWFGFGENWRLHRASREGALDSWSKLVDLADRWGFNTVRLCFAFPDMPGEESWFINYDILDDVLQLLSSRGYKAILCLKPRVEGYFGSPQWFSNWLNLVSHFKNDPRIVAWELYNEPERTGVVNTWHPSIGSDYDFLAAHASLTDQIRFLGDNHPIVWTLTWQMFRDQIVVPGELRRPGVAITLHPWDTGNPETVEEAIEQADNKIAQLLPYRQQGFDLWNGEMGVRGARRGGGLTPEVEKAFAVRIVDQSIRYNLGFSWWRYSFSHYFADIVLEESNY